MKFRVSGIMELDITVEIEANSKDEAIEEVECLYFCINGNAVCTSLNVSRFIEDDTTNLSLEKWDNMSKQDRISYLKEDCDMDDDTAYTNAGLDADRIDESLFENLEVN